MCIDRFFCLFSLKNKEIEKDREKELAIEKIHMNSKRGVHFFIFF